MSGDQEQQVRPVAIVTGAAGRDRGGDRAGTSRCRLSGVRHLSEAVGNEGAGYRVPDVRRDQRRFGAGRGRCRAVTGGPSRCPRQQRRGGIGRWGGGVITGAGEVPVRRQPVRRDSHDQGSPASHAQAGSGADRQHQLGHGPDPGAIHGPVWRQQARPGRLFRVAGPRGQELRGESGAGRAGLHADVLRRQCLPGRPAARRLSIRTNEARRESCGTR